MPVESVTCRTSNGIPKKRPTAGAKPSRNPSATFVPQPAALRLSDAPMRWRRSFVKKPPGFFSASASGRRCTVTQFSNQPPATLPIQRRTPVSAAKKTVPLSSGLSVSNVCAASSGVEERVARREAPEPVEERRARADGEDVRGGGRELRAREAREERRDPLEAVLALARLR